MAVVASVLIPGGIAVYTLFAASTENIKQRFELELRQIRERSQIELTTIKADRQRDELRIARLEKTLIEFGSSRQEIITALNNLSNKLDNLKHIYPTKDELEKKLEKKLDINRLDGRYIKNARASP